MQQEKMQAKRIEKYLDDYKRQILEEAKSLVDKPMPQLSEELFCQFEQTGNRLGYENVYFERRRFLSVLAITADELMAKHAFMPDVAMQNASMPAFEEEEKSLVFRKLEEVIQDICKENCWALPAHVNRQCEGWEYTIDLFSAETAFYLAEISPKLKDKFSAETLHLVREEVLKRVLMPFANSKRPYASWEQCDMNWNAVCNGAIGCTALWLLQDENSDVNSHGKGEEQAVILHNIIHRVTENLPYYLNGFARDGVCLEGLSYYTYGLTFYFVFADLLGRFTGDTRGLLQAPVLYEIATFLQKCYLPGGYTISFSDGNIRERFRVGLSAFMSMHFSDVEIPEMDLAAGPFDDACYRYVTLSRDVEWTQCFVQMGEEELAEYRMPSPKQTVPERELVFAPTIFDVFPDAQWAVIRKNDSAIVIKGGHNDEPHNHNDVGGVIYIEDGNLLLTDLGAGEYTKEYFGERRYENICCSSLGHNVPIISGCGQMAGAEYRARDFARMAEFITLDMAKAYDLEEEERVRRSVFFRRKDGIFEILDVFRLKEGRTVTENLVTPIRPDETESGFVLEAGGERYMVSCSDFTKKRLVECIYHNHAGEKERIWMMQWDVIKEIVKIKINKDYANA